MDPTSGTYAFSTPSQTNNAGHGTNSARDSQQQRLHQTQMTGENAFNSYPSNIANGSHPNVEASHHSHDQAPTSSSQPVTNSSTSYIPNTMDSDETAYLYANPLQDEETDDGRIRNQEAGTKIKDAWIYKQIQARQVRFESHLFNCHVFTFCVANDYFFSNTYVHIV